MRTAILAVPLALLAACVSSGPESNIGKREKPRRIEMSRTSDCVFHRTISDFHAIDDRYVVLFGMGRRKAYLAEIAGGCFDMSSRYTLAAVDGDGNGQICGFGRDSLVYDRLGRLEDCRILALEELNEERRMELGVSGPPAPTRKPKKEEKKDEDREDGD
jgi:Family of unknown function (DUF6491)